jgi:hypothetical protein
MSAVTSPLKVWSPKIPSLCNAAKKGRRRAVASHTQQAPTFDELVALHLQRAFRVAYRITKNREVAEDPPSLIYDVWVLVRALVEHTVNAAYMLQIADAATADAYNDYQQYLAYKVLLDLKAPTSRCCVIWFLIYPSREFRWHFV